MKVTINTDNKTIEIESATMQELEKLCKEYKGYSIISKTIDGERTYIPTLYHFINSINDPDITLTN